MKTPFRTFLDQPGVPFVEAAARVRRRRRATARAILKQSRYLPRRLDGRRERALAGPGLREYPVARAGDKETCSPARRRTEGDLALDATDVPGLGVPERATARATTASPSRPEDLANVRDAGLPRSTTREKIAYGNSLRAAFTRGATHL